MDINSALAWRYATKKFDAFRKLSDEQLTTLLEAINLSATSYGLQPFRVVVVGDTSLREQLKEAAAGQSQIDTASHLLLFAVPETLGERDVDDYIARIAKTRGGSPESLSAYRQRLAGSLASKTPEAIQQWASRQVYIALGVLLTTAATLQIDTCPMEGFDKLRFDALLGLKEHGLRSVVLAAVGFRAADDRYQDLAKVRKPLSELVLHSTL